LRRGESSVLPGEGREEASEDTVGAGGVCQQRERERERERECFSFSGAFKTYTTPHEGRPGDSHPIMNEWGGEWTGEGGLVHPQATYMNPNLFLLPHCNHKPSIRD
jgi:hypothetical protein